MLGYYVSICEYSIGIVKIERREGKEKEREKGKEKENERGKKRFLIFLEMFFILKIELYVYEMKF